MTGSENSVRESAPILLDTENVFRAFGWETFEERTTRYRWRNAPAGAEVRWRGEADRDWASLQVVFPGMRAPEDARELASEVLGSLVLWAEATIGQPAEPRESFGKWSDSAVMRLFATKAFEDHAFIHYSVPKGKNRADERLIERLRELRDSHGVIVVGTADGDIWRVVLEMVDGSVHEGLQFLLALPPKVPRQVPHHRLYKSAGWRDSKGEYEWRVVAPHHRARRQQAIRHEYLNTIHHAFSVEAKRGGRPVAALGSKSPSPVVPPVDWTRVMVLAPKLVPRPEPDRLEHRFRSPEWDKAVRDSLVPTAGQGGAELVRSALDHMASSMYRDDEQMSALDPETWEAFVFFAIYAPRHLPDWPIEGGDREEMWQRMTKFRTDYLRQRTDTDPVV